MMAGWGIAIAAVLLLIAPAPRMAFALAALAVEALGFVLAARSFAARSRTRMDA